MKVELLKNHTHKRIDHKIGSILSIDSETRVNNMIKQGICKKVKLKFSSKKSEKKAIQIKNDSNKY